MLHHKNKRRAACQALWHMHLSTGRLVEAALLTAFFKSPAIAAFGFAEEILPFTDIVPTFTLSWCLSTLWPTTPLASSLQLRTCTSSRWRTS